MRGGAIVHAFVAVVAAALIGIAPASAQGPTVSVGRIASDRACAIYQTVWGVGYAWGTELVRDCTNNFEGIREQIESALASSGRLTIARTAAGAGYVVTGRISEIGSATSGFAQGRTGTVSRSAVVSFQLTVRTGAGAVVWGGLVTKKLETGFAGRAGNTAAIGGQDGRTVYTQIQREVALAVARAISFRIAPMKVTNVSGRRIQLDYGEPLLTLGTIVQVQAPGGMAFVRYVVSSTTTGMALADIDVGGDPRRIGVGATATVLEADSAAANAPRYDRVELGEEYFDSAQPSAPPPPVYAAPAYVPPPVADPAPVPVRSAAAVEPARKATPVAAKLPAAGNAPGPRYALVIGNGAYGGDIGALTNPGRDAQMIAGALRSAGFIVTVVTDADQKTMKRAITQFGQQLIGAPRGSTGLFYYAGHGMQTRGTNYLIPVGAAIKSEADIDLESVAADTVVAQMAEAGISTSIVVLDACRNMPVTRSFRSSTRGLARMEAPNGSFVAYSTAPGSVAQDGVGSSSPFAAALAEEIRTPGETIEVVFRNVRRRVLAATGNQQTPWDSSSLVDSFTFMP